MLLFVTYYKEWHYLQRKEVKIFCILNRFFSEDKDQIWITSNWGRGMGLQICFACPNYPLTKKRGKLRFSTEKNKREIDRLVKLGIKLELYNGSMLCEFGILNFTQFLCSEGQKKKQKFFSQFFYSKGHVW